jgi:hypothetical protein|tara:strand:+ start:111 stop:281 length:171 start_codon:yes stop_codon:yes gene_type:complete
LSFDLEKTGEKKIYKYHHREASFIEEHLIVDNWNLRNRIIAVFILAILLFQNPANF